MRKLRAHVQINAPPERVTALTSRRETPNWLIPQSGPWVRANSPNCSASPHGDGTRLSIELEYRSPIQLLEPFLADSVHHAVLAGLNRLKLEAESQVPAKR